MSTEMSTVIELLTRQIEYLNQRIDDIMADQAFYEKHLVEHQTALNTLRRERAECELAIQKLEADAKKA